LNSNARGDAVGVGSGEKTTADAIRERLARKRRNRPYSTVMGDWRKGVTSPTQSMAALRCQGAEHDQGLRARAVKAIGD